MNIYESLAHTLLSEHGRHLFGSTYMSAHSSGLGDLFWQHALTAYGRDFYLLPKLLNIKKAEGREYSFPAYRISNVMPLGIPPNEALLYPSMGGYGSRTSPIHIATGLMKFGGGRADIQPEIDELLQVNFMKKLWGTHGRKGEEMLSEALPNPYKPSDFGLKPYPLELLQEEGRDVYLDEIGNAFWFPQEYILRAIGTKESSYWYHYIHKLTLWHGQWGDIRERAAYRRLLATRVGKNHSYTDMAKAIRFTSATNARTFLKDATGVSVVAHCFRADATPEDMTKGLRVLANSKSELLDKAFLVIGRKLTIEDLSPLNAPQVLTIINNVNYDMIRELVEKDREAICALLFKLPSSQYQSAMSCLEDRPKREKWYPDTSEGNARLFDMWTGPTGTPPTVESQWSEHIKPIITKYLVMRDWRIKLLEIAPPDVAFLALMAWRTATDAPVPHQAIENVLRSYAWARELQEHVVENHPFPVAPKDVLGPEL